MKHFMHLKNKKIRKLCSFEEVNVDNTKLFFDTITNDYHFVTCDDCKRILQDEILKIPVKKRTENEHMILVKRAGGVRNYLLSMGEFKDVDI